MKQVNIRARKLFHVMLYLLGVFIFQEAVLRFCFPLPEIKNFDRSNYLIQDAENKTIRHLRDQTWYWQSVADTEAVFNHYMNRYGFRDEEWLIRKQKGKKRVIFIGDSFVEGIMAGQNETIPLGFRNSDPRGEYEVFNAGMLGVGLDSYLQLAADIIPLYRPDVVFLCIYANDLGENEPAVPQFYLEPEYFNPLKPRLLELLDQMNHNSPVLFRWAGESRSYLPHCPQRSNPWTNNEQQLRPHVKPWLAAAMKNGTFNPFRTNTFAKEEHYLKKLPKLGETIPFLSFISTKFDTRFVIVYIPSRNQVTRHYYQFEREMCQIECSELMDLTTPAYQLHQQVIASQCRAYKIPFLDLTGIIREREAKDEHLYWRYDEHMQGKGYLLLGKVIWKRWQQGSL